MLIAKVQPRPVHNVYPGPFSNRISVSRPAFRVSTGILVPMYARPVTRPVFPVSTPPDIAVQRVHQGIFMMLKTPHVPMSVLAANGEILFKSYVSTVNLRAKPVVLEGTYVFLV